MDGETESNNIIFVEGLSKVSKTQNLIDLFSRYSGYVEVRHISEKQVAFIEFNNDENAAVAMSEMNGYAIKESNGETSTLRITFAKR